MPLRAGFVGEKFGSIPTMQLVLVGNDVVSDTFGALTVSRTPLLFVNNTKERTSQSPFPALHINFDHGFVRRQFSIRRVLDN